MRALFIAVSAVVGLTGCAPLRTYHWRDYDAALYAHYQNPDAHQAFVESLRTTILEAEQRGLRVPPGIYAEYGYALLEEGNPTEAVTWFKKERSQWPESAVLMEKLIRNAAQRPASPSGTIGPAASAGGHP